MSVRRVFLDHAATTPLSKNARKAMEEWLDAGNPSSLYEEGRRAKAAIDEAREIVSDSLGVDFGEVIFTGSGTESASLAIVGAALAAIHGPKRKILISSAEHHCVINTAGLLRSIGFEPILAPVDRYGRVQTEALTSLLNDGEVLLLAAMHVNNELGTFNDIETIGELCLATDTLLLCDAVQSFGKVPFEARDLRADMISLSAHKINGPKGVGALYIKAGTKIKPVITGGGQEREMRAGTESVAAIAGFGAAVADGKVLHNFHALKDKLLSGLVRLGAIPTVPASIPQLDTHIHVRFPGVKAESFLIVLDRNGVSAGSGAACSSGSIEPSHVLLAAGYDVEEAKEALRFTLGRTTTDADINDGLLQIEAGLRQIGYKLPAGT